MRVKKNSPIAPVVSSFSQIDTRALPCLFSFSAIVRASWAKSRPSWRVYWIELRDRDGKRIIKRLGLVDKAFAVEQHNLLKRSLDDGSYYEKALVWQEVVDAFLRKLELEGRGVSISMIRSSTSTACRPSGAGTGR